MATGKPAQIMAALFAHAALMETTGPTLPISWPEEAESFKTPAPFLEVAIFPNAPAWQGVTSGRMDQGLLQVSVVWPRGQGIIKPGEVAALVMAHFAKTTELYDGGTKVKISAEPWAAQPLYEPDRVAIPVTIPWTA